MASGEWQAASQKIDHLLSLCELGRHLTVPWRVVLVGPPNVGKSSLINALAGFQRAIVSHVPGTTRDVVTVATAIDGWPVELADTAGLRAGGDELEAAGMTLASAAAARADLAVVMRDASQPDNFQWVAVESALLPALTRRIDVVNKIDLVTQPCDGSADSNAIMTSAVTGEGIADLAVAIGRILVARAPAAGAAVPFTAEQSAALTTARQAVERRDRQVAAAALQPLLAR
jgi:tRNA modification GTPase